MAWSDVPNRRRIGYPMISPRIVRAAAVMIRRKKEVFWIMDASFLLPAPRDMEKRGAPPLPNMFVKAVIRITIGKHIPTAPSAEVPISGMRAI